MRRAAVVWLTCSLLTAAQRAARIGNREKIFEIVPIKHDVLFCTFAEHIGNIVV